MHLILIALLLNLRVPFLTLLITMLQLSGLQEELNEAKQAMLKSEKKLKFKEETAAATMSTRDAAIKSLRLADMRASRLGERVEELSRHLEDSRNRSRQRYVFGRF
ncbi:hypothetical protein FRX31_005211 [Thalictrum thalictroides]|uniref:Paramyosin n=1 Tax=Thalictrum thalictroides TaxID=46969 RepID=A0A7J6X9W3_THATH|nr:hypothetical protein FRX31_005211 [Thalictrum thalictroides]